jgi:hypothetical protein
MKVKCLIDECDVKAGKEYLAHEDGDTGTVWVTDDVGDDYPLFLNEYEVLNDE